MGQFANSGYFQNYWLFRISANVVEWGWYRKHKVWEYDMSSCEIVFFDAPTGDITGRY